MSTTLTKSYLRGRWLWEAEAEGKVVESGWAATPEEAEANYLAWSATYVAPVPEPVQIIRPPNTDIAAYVRNPGNFSSILCPELEAKSADPLSYEYEDGIPALPQITVPPSKAYTSVTITSGTGFAIAPVDYSWTVTEVENKLGLLPSTGAFHGPSVLPTVTHLSGIYGPNILRRNSAVAASSPRLREPQLSPNGTFKSERKENLGGVIWNALGEAARPFLAGLDSVDKKLALTPVVTGAHNATDYEILRNQLAVDARLVRDPVRIVAFEDQISAMARQLAEVLPDVIRACDGVLHQFHTPSLLWMGLDPTSGVSYNAVFEWLVMKAPPASKSSSDDMADSIRYAMAALKKKEAPVSPVLAPLMRRTIDKITDSLICTMSPDFYDGVKTLRPGGGFTMTTGACGNTAGLITYTEE